MTTLNEQLDRVAALMKRATRHEVEVADGSVYVNYDFSAAVVITPQLEPAGQRYYVEALHWDRTHGVDSEHEIGAFTLAELPASVNDFLERVAEEERKLEAILAQIPEDL